LRTDLRAPDIPTGSGPSSLDMNFIFFM
jgi:hypothetical protein